MSYYKYLERYSPSFLRRYQTNHYANLQRSTKFADIVNMNATASLTLDDDITLSHKAPFKLANVFGLIALVYWFYYHVPMFQANTIRYRLRSYHTFKMWARLEKVIVEVTEKTDENMRELLFKEYLQGYNLTPELADAWAEKVKEGLSEDDALASLGYKYDHHLERVLKV